MHNYSLRRYWVTTIVLLIIAITIKLFSLNHSLVEEYYTNGIYILISRALRIVTGWMPFSIGDLLYAIAIIWIGANVVHHTAALFRRRVTKKTFVRGAIKTVTL